MVKLTYNSRENWSKGQKIGQRCLNPGIDCEEAQGNL